MSIATNIPITPWINDPQRTAQIKFETDPKGKAFSQRIYQVPTNQFTGLYLIGNTSSGLLDAIAIISIIFAIVLAIIGGIVFWKKRPNGGGSAGGASGGQPASGIGYADGSGEPGEGSQVVIFMSRTPSPVVLPSHSKVFVYL